MVFAIEPDAAAAEVYARLHPSARVACEPLETSSFFGQIFNGIVAWGLLFLLPPPVMWLAPVRRLGLEDHGDGLAVCIELEAQRAGGAVFVEELGGEERPCVAG